MYKQVIKVHQHTILKALHYPIHEPLKRARGVAKAKRHDCKLEQTPLGVERSHVLVTLLHANLVITLLQVQAGKELTRPQSVEQFVNTGNGVPIHTRVCI